MRRFAFAVVVTASVFGCSDEAPPPFFADMQWQLRCRVMGMCSGIPSHDINNVDGEDDHDIECTIDGAVDETRTFYMKAYKAADYGVEIRNANFTGTGSPISGAGCIVKVVEGANTFRGIFYLAMF